jgi:hypothetical protein
MFAAVAPDLTKEGGPYGTCRVWTDPYWQYLQAKELKKT